MPNIYLRHVGGSTELAQFFGENTKHTGGDGDKDHTSQKPQWREMPHFMVLSNK
jgi:hypothetical protein